MRRCYLLFMTLMLVCIGCEWHLSGSGKPSEPAVVVERYDRIQSLYLTTGDFSALQQMNTSYPQQTRMLIEDVLRIGQVNEPEINVKFLNFFQDTTLQELIAASEQEFASMADIDRDFSDAFVRLQQLLPGIAVPQIYAQIGSLDQSIIVGNGILGISLDKYLGSNYPLYLRESYGYTPEQRSMMTRQYIVPDCIGFYLLSLYPMPFDRELSQLERDIHIGKVQWVVNQALDRTIFNTLYTRNVGHYMKSHPDVSVDQMLKTSNLFKTTSRKNTET